MAVCIEYLADKKIKYLLPNHTHEYSVLTPTKVNSRHHRLYKNKPATTKSSYDNDKSSSAKQTR